MLFAFSSSFHHETFRHTPFRITLQILNCAEMQLSQNWTSCGQKLHYWRWRNRVIALSSYALFILMEYKWSPYLVNDLNTIESMLKISDLIKKEVFQRLTLNSQNILWDEQMCELQLSIIIFIMHHAFITATFLTVDKIGRTCSCPGRFLSSWKKRILIRNFKKIRKIIITIFWHGKNKRDRQIVARDYLQKRYCDEQHQFR